MKNLTKNKRLDEITFTRSCCCIGIVIFHYFCHANGRFKPLYKTKNSSFGFMFVTSFFCISGVVLYYNYPKIKSIKSFYYKRWKAIFPSYYLCYLYFLFLYTFYFKKIDFRGHWSKILLTIIGLDGFLYYKIKTYYLVGEWFLGAIIIIYFLYPFLLFVINKNNIIINNIILCLLYYLMCKSNYFVIDKTKNIITCITSFYFGIEMFRFKKFYLHNKIMILIWFLLLLLLSLIKVKKFIIIFQIQGFSLYIVLIKIGQNIQNKVLKYIINKISYLSYHIFLFHHQVIYNILSIYNPTEWYKHIILLFIIFLLIIIHSNIHLIIVNSIIKSSLFKILDSIFI